MATPVNRQCLCSHHVYTVWTIRQIASAEYHILEVLNFELTTPTQAAWIEIFARRLSLWEEQRQQPYHPHIPLPIVLPDGAHLIAEAHLRKHSLSVNSRASQIGWSLSLVHIRRLLGMSGTGGSSPEVSQLRIVPSLVERHATFFLSFVHVAPCSHWKCT